VGGWVVGFMEKRAYQFATVGPNGPFHPHTPARTKQAVDIWVPLRDPASGRLSLQFGGGLAVRPTLSQWVFYSRNFAFYEGQVRARCWFWLCLAVWG
jgi:hypothetical protein